MQIYRCLSAKSIFDGLISFEKADMIISVALNSRGSLNPVKQISQSYRRSYFD